MILQQLKGYGQHYNMERAIPSIYSGLKPAQQKILYTAIQLGLHNKTTKMVQLTGATMNIYTHGDASLETTIYRMAQNWKTTYPLFSVEGNVGSQASLHQPDSGAAAARYLTLQLSGIGKAYSQSHKDGLSVMTTNEFTGAPEPSHMFVPFPAFLLFNQLGIGVGVATNFPSFTLSSVVDYASALLEDENAACNLQPVFSDKATVVNGKDLPEVYNGNKSIRLRATYTKKADTLEITNFPPTACPAIVMEQIEKKVDKVLSFGSIVDMQDVSTVGKKGEVVVKLVLKLRRNTKTDKLIEDLNLETDLETFAPMNLTLLGRDGLPHRYSVQSAVLEWNEIFKEKMQDKLHQEKDRLQADIHILDGLQRALDDIDAIIELIKTSVDRKDAVGKLGARGYTAVQSDAILDMKLSKLANMEYADLLQRNQQKKAELEEVERLLGDKAAFIGYLQSTLAEQKQYEVYAKGCAVEHSPITRVKEVETHTVKMVRGRLSVDKGGVDMRDAVYIVGDTVSAVSVDDNNKKVDMLLHPSTSVGEVITVSKDNRVKRTPVKELLGSRKSIYTKQEDLVYIGIVEEPQIKVNTNKGYIVFNIDEVPVTGKGRLGVKVAMLRRDEVIESAMQVNEPTKVKSRNSTTIKEKK